MSFAPMLSEYGKLLDKPVRGGMHALYLETWQATTIATEYDSAHPRGRRAAEICLLKVCWRENFRRKESHSK